MNYKHTFIVNFFKYDTYMLYMYMLREILLLDTNQPLSCDRDKLSATV